MKTVRTVIKRWQEIQKKIASGPKFVGEFRKGQHFKQRRRHSR
jgi:hypothetical protein